MANPNSNQFNVCTTNNENNNNTLHIKKNIIFIYIKFYDVIKTYDAVTIFDIILNLKDNLIH